MRKKLIFMLIMVLCLSLGACGVSNKEKRQVNSLVHAMENNTSYPSAVNVFSTVDFEGNKVTNDIFAEADITVVNFWGTFCSPCIDEMEELAEWAEEMPENVQLIGAVVDVESTESEEYALAQEIVEKTGVQYKNVIAIGAFDRFVNNLVGVPTTFFFDKEGKVIGEPVVGAKIEEYKQHVEDYLNEQK